MSAPAASRHRLVPLVIAALGAVAALVALGGCGSDPGAMAAPYGTRNGSAPTRDATTTVDPRLLPLGPGPDTVLVVGDSVMLGAKAQVPLALPGWKVTFDAKESRRIQAGIGILRAWTGPPPRVAVIHLCTNWGGDGYADQIDRAMAALPGVERVVWLTCEPWTDAVARADDEIRRAAERYPNVVVADWATVGEQPGLTYRDHLHLRPPGAVALAALVAEAVGPAPTPTPARAN